MLRRSGVTRFLTDRTGGRFGIDDCGAGRSRCCAAVKNDQPLPGSGPPSVPSPGVRLLSGVEIAKALRASNLSCAGRGRRSRDRTGANLARFPLRRVTFPGFCIPSRARVPIDEEPMDRRRRHAAGASLSTPSIATETAPGIPAAKLSTSVCRSTGLGRQTAQRFGIELHRVRISGPASIAGGGVRRDRDFLVKPHFHLHRHVGPACCGDLDGHLVAWKPARSGEAVPSRTRYSRSEVAGGVVDRLARFPPAAGVSTTTAPGGAAPESSTTVPASVRVCAPAYAGAEKDLRERPTHRWLSCVTPPLGIGRTYRRVGAEQFEQFAGSDDRPPSSPHGAASGPQVPTPPRRPARSTAPRQPRQSAQPRRPVQSRPTVSSCSPAPPSARRRAVARQNVEAGSRAPRPSHPCSGSTEV